MNLSLHFLIYKWNNTTSANRFLLSMQGGGQSGPVFRKLSQRWWWWQWDLSHRPCCALCSSQTLGFPVLGSTLIACVWVLCSGCSSSVYYLSGSYDQDLCFWRVGELHPTNLTDESYLPATLSLWPVGFPVVHVLLDTVPTTWNFFSNWQIAVYLWGQGEMACLLTPSLILSVESCSLSLNFWS